MPVFIGTAGYVYSHWRKGRFYPSSTTQSEELSYYLSRYPSVEINATWHAFPRPSTLAKWKAAARPTTRFALKAPKLITHTKRLAHASDDILAFCKLATDGLAECLGPLLFQCPPSLPLSMVLLDGFVEDLQRARDETGVDLKIALEFRNPEWFCQDVFALLSKHDIALVNNIVVRDNDFSIVDDDLLPHCRRTDVPRAKWTYNRFHGSKNPGVSTDFPDSVLQDFAKEAAREVKCSSGFTHYSFFLNDLDAIAPKSARRYAELVANEMSVNVKNLFPGFVPEWTKAKRDITSFFKSTPGSAKPKVTPTQSLQSMFPGKPAGGVGKVINKNKVKQPSPFPMKKASPTRKRPSAKPKKKDITSYFTLRDEKG